MRKIIEQRMAAKMPFRILVTDYSVNGATITLEVYPGQWKVTELGDEFFTVERPSESFRDRYQCQAIAYSRINRIEWVE